MRLVAINTVLVALTVATTNPAVGGELTADLSGESRLFAHTAAYGGSGQIHGSAALAMEYYHEWFERGEQLVVSPFARVDFADGRRTHVDLRELYWHKRFEDWEIGIGMRHVFWGVTESAHLVDVINQTDLVENIDGEDKLGQPMVHITRMTRFGTFEAFWLPFFRERTFPGTDGRLRSAPIINEDEALYESGAAEWHQDFALRWSHSIGAVDVGLAYFTGTDRQPDFIPYVGDNGSIEFRPYYRQTDRLGVDLLYVIGGWLWKLEAITQNRADQQNLSAVGGFEYTFVGAFGSRFDLGIVSEYLFDDRGSKAGPFEHDLFLGGRLALNDIGGTSILAGVIVDTENGSTVALVEADRRLTDWWSLELEVRAFMNQKTGDFLYDFRRDDLVQMTMIRHF